VAQADRVGVRVRGVDGGLDDLRRRVDFADADDPLVGVDAHDQVVLAAIRDRVVDVGLPQNDRLDLGNLHRAPPLAASRTDRPARRMMGRAAIII
jgi:hypothetical protein